MLGAGEAQDFLGFGAGSILPSRNISKRFANLSNFCVWGGLVLNLGEESEQLRAGLGVF